MQLFYTTEFKGNHAILDKNDSGHLIRVLRKQKGDQVHFTDGKGNLYTGMIEIDDPKKCMIQIIEKKENFEKRDYFLHLAVAPTKNLIRFEWLIEKATEIGIDEITPIICNHSERKVIKTERLERVALAAMKQSLKAWLPKINDAIGFNEFISLKQKAQKFIAYISPDVTNLLQDDYEKGNNSIVLIGPEGDFDIEEIRLAKEYRYTPISLGKNRLRTETAGIVSCTIIHLMNQ